MSTLYYLNQYISKTLNTTGGINATQTADIELPDVTGVDISNPGIACLSYADPLDTDSAEWITYTSINNTTKKFVGVTRGAEGYSAKVHAKGVTIAFPISKSHINNLNNLLTGTAIPNDLNLGATYNIQVAGVDPNRTITLTPGFIKPTTTGGCASSETVEAGTNDIDYDVLAFDTTTAERAFCNFQMPNSYDGGVIQFRYVWTNASGLTTETVEFELAGRAFADDDAIDQANGAAVGLADTWIAQNDVHISAWSGDVTLAGTPAGNQWVHLEIERDVANDDLTGDARLIALQIRYRQAQYSD